LFSSIASKKDWTEYRLPYKVVVPEREVANGKLIYHDVRLRIFNHEGFLKTGLVSLLLIKLVGVIKYL
jgi:hypothetical protein